MENKEKREEKWRGKKEGERKEERERERGKEVVGWKEEGRGKTRYQRKLLPFPEALCYTCPEADIKISKP